MSEMGIPCRDELIVFVAAALALRSWRRGICPEALVANVAPAILEEFAAADTAPANSARQPDARDEKTAREADGRALLHLDILLSEEARRLGFQRETQEMGVAWILIAMLLADHSIDEVKAFLPTLVKVLRTAVGRLPRP